MFMASKTVLEKSVWGFIDFAERLKAISRSKPFYIQSRFSV
jgi:hypothetical protein